MTELDWDKAKGKEEVLIIVATAGDLGRKNNILAAFGPVNIVKSLVVEPSDLVGSSSSRVKPDKYLTLILA